MRFSVVPAAEREILISYFLTFSQQWAPIFSDLTCSLLVGPCPCCCCVPVRCLCVSDSFRKRASRVRMHARYVWFGGVQTPFSIRITTLLRGITFPVRVTLEKMVGTPSVCETTITNPALNPKSIGPNQPMVRSSGTRTHSTLAAVRCCCRCAGYWVFALSWVRSIGTRTHSILFSSSTVLLQLRRLLEFCPVLIPHSKCVLRVMCGHTEGAWSGWALDQCVLPAQ